jgi:hypothetical protein
LVLEDYFGKESWVTGTKLQCVRLVPLHSIIERISELRRWDMHLIRGHLNNGIRSIQDISLIIGHKDRGPGSSLKSE